MGYELLPGWLTIDTLLQSPSAAGKFALAAVASAATVSRVGSTKEFQSAFWTKAYVMLF
jgi:hypothetical protein